jgi:MFS transporter, BCD family, chlorophyll transporter
MAQVLLLGTLNRVMIVELSVPAIVVALMIALPVLSHRSARFSASGPTPTARHRVEAVPYLWFGSLWQMGGLAVMPFALIVLSGDQ